MNSEEMESKIKNNVRNCIALSNIKEEISTNTLRRKEIFYKMLTSCSEFVICGLILIGSYSKLKIKDAKLNEKVSIQEKIASNQNNITSEINNALDEEKNSNAYINEEGKNKKSNKTENDKNIVDSNEKKSIDLKEKETNKDSNKILSIAKVMQEVDKKKIFYEKVTTSDNVMFAYNPTVENLYKNADVVIVGKYNSDLKIYTIGVNIYTQTRFNVSKVIKNTTKLDVSESITFDRSGGVVSLDNYMNNNTTIRDDEFKDIKVSERKYYYIIQEYGPENKLDFTQQKNNSSEYMLFLKLIDNQFVTCATYYGIRKISNNKLYDYDRNNYIEITNDMINMAL